jgi:hypothetical protein
VGTSDGIPIIPAVAGVSTLLLLVTLVIHDVSGFPFKVTALAVVSTVAGIPDNAIIVASVPAVADNSTFAGVPSVHDVLTAAGHLGLAGVFYFVGIPAVACIIAAVGVPAIAYVSAVAYTIGCKSADDFSSNVSKYLSSK